MLSSEDTNMVIQSWLSQADLLLKNYVSADPLIICTSISLGLVTCKTVYQLARMISAFYFKSNVNLSKSRQVEWSNRAMSTFHAVYITTMSFYFVFASDLYSDHLHDGPITIRSSALSTFGLGVSVGYFLSDLGMIIWCYPSLGGMEYVIHHLLSLLGVIHSMLMGEGQLYTYMVLISEATTPSINLRWYLDAAGMKKSRAYVINGVVIFLSWLVARIVLFAYLFYHVYLNYNQVKQMHTSGMLLVHFVPSVIYVMNLLWFWKILKGLKKTLEKRE